jgi:hypothetical protein
VTDRFSTQRGPGPFAGEPWWEFAPTLLAQALPWTPLALAGSYRSLRRALSPLARVFRPADRPGQSQLPAIVVAGDRLLWVWTAVPLALLSMATVKNAHYAIAAQVPWSIWTALALVRLGEVLRRRGWSRSKLRFTACAGFASLALLYGTCLWLIAPRFDRRGVEWAFYQSVGQALPATTPLTFLYDDWDRLPYKCPFGAFPHDLAVRLFYLGRPACWHLGTDALREGHHHTFCRARFEVPSTGKSPSSSHAPGEFVVVGRDRDLPELKQLGRVEIISRGPSIRKDRAYTLFRTSSRTR